MKSFTSAVLSGTTEPQELPSHIPKSRFCEGLTSHVSARWVFFNNLLGMSMGFLFAVFRVPLATRNISLVRVLGLRVSLTNLIIGAACIALWWFALHMLNLARSCRRDMLAYHAELLVCVTICCGVVGLVLAALRPAELSLELVLAFGATSLGLLLVSRYLVAAWQMVVGPHLRRSRNLIIVGSGWRAQHTAERLRSNPKWRYHLIGFVDSELYGPVQPFLGATSELAQILMLHSVDEVIITLPIKSKYDEIQAAIAACELVGVQLGYSTDLFATQVAKRRSTEESDPTSVRLHMVHNDTRHTFKRMLDVVVAGAALTLLSPLMLLIAVCIRLAGEGPIIFRQKRYGLNKRLFTMYKFRTMVPDAELQQKKLEHLNETSGPVFKIRSDPRITPLGRLLRKSSLDELPQLWNVLRGNMSLVGPRPLPVRDVKLFEEAGLMRRFSVKPGLTGLWQVSGRSNTSFDNWIRLDLEYIDKWSFLLDCRIMAMTFPAVLRREGAA